MTFSLLLLPRFTLSMYDVFRRETIQNYHTNNISVGNKFHCYKIILSRQLFRTLIPVVEIKTNNEDQIRKKKFQFNSRIVIS
jgi:hypothetical protein